jgi:osmotically-inducible protein OsmY
MHLKRVVAIAALTIGLLHGQGTPDDDRIYDQVRLKLASDTTVRGGGFEVEVHAGVVTLRGKVKQTKQKQKAERLTRKIKGVTKVVNELTVETPQK